MISGRNIYQLSQFVCDLIALTIGWYATVFARVALNPLAVTDRTAESAQQWAPPLGWLLVAWVVTAMFLRVYASPIRREVWTSIRRAAETTVSVLLVAASVMYFASDLTRDKSRSFMLIFSPLSFGFLTTSRFTAHALSVRVARKLPPSDYVAVLGSGPSGTEVAKRLRGLPYGNRFRGIILPEGEQWPSTEEAPVLGTTTGLAAMINRERIAEIIVANSGTPMIDLELAFEICLRMGVLMSWAVLPSEESGHESDIELIDYRGPSFNPWQESAKQTLDIIFASAALVLLAPLFLLIAIAIRLDSKGPLLYCSPRVGKGGRYFTFLKFRSMYTSAPRTDVIGRNEKNGHIFKIRDDPRVTRVGRILRRYSLDELPQLANVLCGDMSLVGPRPLPAEDLGPDGMSQRFVVWSKHRAGRRPGITGLWQIRGRSRLQFDDMVRCDEEYVRNWSLRLDLIILAKTPLLVLIGDGAY